METFSCFLLCCGRWFAYFVKAAIQLIIESHWSPLVSIHMLSNIYAFLCLWTGPHGENVKLMLNIISCYSMLIFRLRPTRVHMWPAVKVQQPSQGIHQKLRGSALCCDGVCYLTKCTWEVSCTDGETPQFGDNLWDFPGAAVKTRSYGCTCVLLLLLLPLSSPSNAAGGTVYDSFNQLTVALSQI